MGLRCICPIGEEEMRERPRPKSAVAIKEDTQHQHYTLYGTMRSSDVYGAKGMQAPGLSKNPSAKCPSSHKYSLMWGVLSWDEDALRAHAKLGRASPIV